MDVNNPLNRIILTIFGAPLCLIDKKFYAWNMNVYGSKTFAEFQAGRASSLAIALLFSPLLVFSTGANFVLALGFILIIAIIVPNWLSKGVEKSGIEELIDQYISNNPLLANVWVIGIFAVLIAYVLTTVNIHNHYK